MRRAMLAMTLAQQASVVMLDEPTTFLDLAHQAEVLDLVHQIHHVEGRTVVLVLHDLWQAARYADHLVVMDEGRIAETGTPSQIVSSGVLQRVFGVDLHMAVDPQTGETLPVPIG